MKSAKEIHDYLTNLAMEAFDRAWTDDTLPWNRETVERCARERMAQAAQAWVCDLDRLSDAENRLSVIEYLTRDSNE